MKKALIFLVLFTFILNSLNVFAITPDNLPLAVRIEAERENLDKQQTERLKLIDEVSRLQRALEVMRKTQSELRDGTLRSVAFFYIKLMLQAVQSLTLDIREVALNIGQELLNFDDLFQTTSNDDHAKAFVKLQQARDRLAKGVSAIEQIKSQKAQEVNRKEDEIGITKAEIARLKELYKKAMGADYIEKARAESIALTMENADAAGVRPVENGTHGTAYGAAFEQYQNRVQLSPGVEITEPVMINQDNTGTISIFRMYYIFPERWDGSLNVPVNSPSREYWLLIKRTEDGMYKYIDSQNPQLAPPVIKAQAGDIEEGKEVALKAEVETVTGEPPRRIYWFTEYREANNFDNKKVEKIGEGPEISYRIPDDWPWGGIFVIAEDNLYQTTKMIVAGYFDRGYYYPRRDDEELRIEPSLPEHGDLVSITLSLEFDKLCEVEVDWYEGLNASSATTVGTWSRTEGGKYICSTAFTFTANGFSMITDEGAGIKEGDPVSSQNIRCTIRAKTGSAERMNASKFISVNLGTKHLEESNKQKQDEAIASVNAKKLEYDISYKNYQEQLASLGNYAFGDGIDLHSLTVRSKQYADWRLGLAQADMAWGENYTFSLFRSESENSLAALKQMCQKLGLNHGIDLDEAMKEPSSEYNWDDVFKYRLKVIASYFPQLKTLFDRRNALAEEYKKATNARDALSSMTKDLDKSMLAFDPDTLPLPSETIYEIGSEAYTQLDNYLAMLNNDISRIPSQRDLQPAVQSDHDEIKVEVNSSLVRGDVAPIIINGRTMVPIRFVAEALDCLVDWRGTDNTVIITPKGADKVDPPVTDKSLKIYVSSKLIIPDVPPRIVDGRTLVPIRFVAEALNADVSWDGALRKVIIKTK